MHTITVTATDAAGNSATCSTTLTVTDTTVPTISCSAIAPISADGTCQALVPNVLAGVTASDACSSASNINLTQSPAAGTSVGLGTHTITVTATDAAGNSAACSTTLTVADTTVPTISCSAIAPISADGTCQATVPTALAGVTASAACSSPSQDVGH